MKTLVTLYYILFFFIFTVSVANSQVTEEDKRIVQRGNRALENNDFKSAEDDYKLIVNKYSKCDSWECRYYKAAAYAGLGNMYTEIIIRAMNEYIENHKERVKDPKNQQLKIRRSELLDTLKGKNFYKNMIDNYQNALNLYQSCNLKGSNTSTDLIVKILNRVKPLDTEIDKIITQPDDQLEILTQEELQEELRKEIEKIKKQNDLMIDKYNELTSTLLINNKLWDLAVKLITSNQNKECFENEFNLIKSKRDNIIKKYSYEPKSAYPISFNYDLNTLIGAIKDIEEFNKEIDQLKEKIHECRKVQISKSSKFGIGLGTNIEFWNNYSSTSTNQINFGVSFGIFSRFDVFDIFNRNCFFQPEILYIKRGLSWSGTGIYDLEDGKASFESLDIPLSIGYDILPNFNIKLGGIFSFNLSKEISVNYSITKRLLTDERIPTPLDYYLFIGAGYSFELINKKFEIEGRYSMSIEKRFNSIDNLNSHAFYITIFSFF